jgi:exopolysaccharide production protein ExoY
MLTQAAGATQDASPTESTSPAVVTERRIGAPTERRHRVTDPQVVFAARRANGPAKRFFDVTASALGLAFLAPVFVTIALVIKISDRGPIFYGHPRAGRCAKTFRCWKFRTMKTNGPEILERHLAENPAAAEEWAQTQKLTNDPRVTAIGKFLRATSLDELPQLFNVLIGEMSVIGPRPVPKAELDERYAHNRRFYLLVRPGITGLWQVSGRSNTSYQRRVALDREYIMSWSFAGELQILLKTIPAVLKADGAR